MVSIGVSAVTPGLRDDIDFQLVQILGVDKDLVFAIARVGVNAVLIRKVLFVFHGAVRKPVALGLPAGVTAVGVFGVHFCAHQITGVVFWLAGTVVGFVYLEHFARRGDADFRAVGIKQGVIQVLVDLLLVMFGIGAVIGAAHVAHTNFYGRGLGQVGAGDQQQGEAAGEGGAGGKVGLHIRFP